MVVAEILLRIQSRTSIFLDKNSQLKNTIKFDKDSCQFYMLACKSQRNPQICFMQ